MSERHGPREPRPMDEPAPVVTGRARSDEWVYDRRQGHTSGGVRTMVRPIPMDEPAPTIGGVGAARGRDVWLRKRDARDERKEAGAGNQPRSVDAPAPTIDTGIRQAEWTTERPATTVTADPRIARPGHHGSGDDRDPAARSMTDSVPVTVEQAAALQSFPDDYPWQGSRSKRHEQVGNAVPPLLARAILESLTEGHEVTEAIDLFAGAGGWDVGARDLGIDPLGVEYDDNACATRNAEGLRTLQGDVSALDPSDVAAMAADVPEAEAA